MALNCGDDERSARPLSGGIADTDRWLTDDLPSGGSIPKERISNSFNVENKRGGRPTERVSNWAALERSAEQYEIQILSNFPRGIRGRAATQINAAISFASQVLDQVDAILQANGRSPFIDPDEDAETHARERSQRLKQLDELRPGSLTAVPPQQRVKRRRG
jgi:hypothetical protein